MFLIGAGFTKAVFPEAPLNKDLFYEVVRANPKTKLNLYSKKYGTEDIEILLTRLDLEIAETRSSVLEKDRRHIESDLAEYFSRCRFAQNRNKLDEKPWLKKFAIEVLHENDAIITTNYDCFLEGLLDFCEVWSPKGGYVTLENSPLWEQDNPKNIRIFKLHGSEHFIEAPDPANETKTSIGFPLNESIYPRSGKYTNFAYGMGGPASHAYIIAPSFVKVAHQDIELMMTKAVKDAACASSFIIIGCGMRREDSFLWLLLTTFLNQRANDRTLAIVDPRAEDVAESIVAHYFRDIREFMRMKTLPKKIQEATPELIAELHGNPN